MPDGNTTVIIQGKKRFEIEEVVEETPEDTFEDLDVTLNDGLENEPEPDFTEDFEEEVLEEEVVEEVEEPVVEKKTTKKKTSTPTEPGMYYEGNKITSVPSRIGRKWSVIIDGKRHKVLKKDIVTIK
jgi:hypothetical protein